MIQIVIDTTLSDNFLLFTSPGACNSRTDLGSDVEWRGDGR
jgi:hypothetical protein